MNEIFGAFLNSSTCKEALSTFHTLCEATGVSYPPKQTGAENHCNFYSRLKKCLSSSWKAQSLFAKLHKKYVDKVNFKSSHNNKEDGERIAKDFKILIIGAGPVGLRSAIDMALIGAKTIVIEKRDSFSRNNVLHLWPFTIEDLRSLGAKKFNGRFCSGAIDHVSIRKLQLMLLKAALLFGVEIHVNTSFCDLIEPTCENGVNRGWRAEVEPPSKVFTSFEFDVIIGADGRKDSLKGFKKNVFRASLAIGITVNFINRHSSDEAKVPEISGINFIYRQEFFRELNKKFGIDLENIVYYKDDTHYFVMTAKKQSLLERGVFKQALDDPSQLVNYKNIDQAALLKYALDAVNFSTDYKLPDLEVAINNYGLPDIALFDFTCMKSSVNASMFREVNGRSLLACLVGDGLLEPFWPRGTGIAKGFLAAFDNAWMVRQWAARRSMEQEKSLKLALLAEREAIYRILAQTENKNIVPDFSSFSLNPKTRYQHVPRSLAHHMVEEFCVSDREGHKKQGELLVVRDRTIVPSTLTRNVSFLKSKNLLNWCQSILRQNTKIQLTDMSSSWKNGLALCYLIGHFRCDLIDTDELSPKNAEYNNQLGFDVAEQHLGISPIMSGREMADCDEVDELLIITYISQFYEIFKKENRIEDKDSEESKTQSPPSSKEEKKKFHGLGSSSPVGLLTRLSQQIKRKSLQRNAKGYNMYDQEPKRKKVTKAQEQVAGLDSENVVLTQAVVTTNDQDDKENKVVLREKPQSEARMPKNAGNRISALGNQLISKFEQNSSSTDELNRKSSTVCYFCGDKVYIVERLSVEGLFFHRQCFRCNHCNVTLRPMNYKRNVKTGKFFCEVHYYVGTDVTKLASEIQPVKVKGENTQTSEVRDVEGQDMEEDDETPLLATIERGQVVLKPDLTPTARLMESPAFVFPSMAEEVPEEVLTKHNLSIHLSHDSDQDISSSSDEEEWKEIAFETLGNQTPEQILADYHSRNSLQRSAELGSDYNQSSTTDATLLSSCSDGESQVSSLSESGDEYASVASDNPDILEEVSSLKNIEKTETDDKQVITSVGGGGDFAVTDEPECLKEDLSQVVSAAGDAPEQIKLDDESDELQQPISIETDLPPASDNALLPETEDEPQSIIDSNLGLEDEITYTKFSPHQLPHVSLTQISSVSDVQEANDCSDNTSIWSESGEKEKMPVSTVHESSVKGFSACFSTMESDADASPNTPINNPNDSLLKTPERNEDSETEEIFYTPAANLQEQSPLESFHSFVDETDGSFDESFTSPAKSSPRKLPEVPRATGRRLLPVVPKIQHLEALSPTKSESSPRDQAYVHHDLKRREERVHARIQKMKQQQSHTPMNQDSYASTPTGNKDGVNGMSGSSKLKTHSKRIPGFSKKKLKPPNWAAGEPTKKAERRKPLKYFGFMHKKKTGKKSEEAPSPPSSSFTHEDIDIKIARRVRVAAQRQARQAEQKRLARALVIQQQLEEVDTKRKLLEEKGVMLEKSLHSEKSEWAAKHRESSALMHDWFELVQEKNALLRYENELMIYQRELQLEDRQSRLQQDLRERLAVDDSKKSTAELSKEKIILNEMLDVIEQRNQLVDLLDEHRQQDKEESEDIEGLLLEKFSRISSGTHSYLAPS